MSQIQASRSQPDKGLISNDMESYSNSCGGTRLKKKRLSQRLRTGSWLKLILTMIPLLAFAAVFGWIILPAISRYLISKMIVLSEERSPELYAAWIHAPIQVHLKAYLFNVTNPHQVQQGMTPKLEEIGPFVFIRNRTKFDVQIDPQLDTISYMEHRDFQFLPNLSVSPHLQDKVTLINVPFVAAAMIIWDEVPWPLRDFAHGILVSYKEPPFVQKTVEETLFGGWQVPFLQKIEQDLGLSLIANNSFGYLLERNNSVVGPFTAYRGLHDGTKVASVFKYKNKTHLDFWGDANSPCNKIEGTDATFFPPSIDQSTILHIFNPDTCRSFGMAYGGGVQVKGIAGYRFRVDEHFYKDPRTWEANSCFCATVENEPEKCLGQGLLDIGPCREGAPVAVSPPYFEHGLPEYKEKCGFKSESRDGSKYDTFVDVEPVTGITLRGSNRVQVNLKLKPVQALSSLSHLPQMMFPLLWLDEAAELDEEHAQELNSILLKIWLVESLLKWLMVAAILVACIALINRHQRRLNAYFVSKRSALSLAN